MKKINLFLANEYCFAVFNKCLMVVLGLIYSVLMARYLGPEIKGEITYVQSIVSTLAIVITFGIHHSYPFFRKQAKSRKYIIEYMNSVYLLFGIYLIVIACISLIASKHTYVLSCALMTPVFAYSCISGYVLLVEQPNRRNLAISLISLLEIIYMLVLIKFTERSYFLGISAISFVELAKCCYFTIAIKVKINITKKNFKNLIKILQFGFFPMIALLMTTLNYRIDIMMLKGYSSISLGQIGIYSIGVQLAEKALLVSDSVKEILLSRLAKGQEDTEVARVMRLCFPIAIFMSVAIFLLGKQFIYVLYGAEYSRAYSVTVISMFGTVFMVFFKMITQYNIVNQKQLLNVIMLALSIVVNIVCNLCFVPIWGIDGAALGSTIGYCICAFVFILYFHKVSNIAIRKMIFIQKSDIEILMKVLTSKKKDNTLF